MKILITGLQWLFSKSGKPYLIFFGIILTCLIILKQCNDISSLHNQIIQKELDNKRIENNYKASIDTIKQSYDSSTQTTKAVISGYDLTVKELQTKYSNLFDDISSIKSQWKKEEQPSSIIENTYVIHDNVKDADIKSALVDSAGNGQISISIDTVFSPGNSRKTAGNISYKLYFHNKKDSTIADYKNIAYNVGLIPNSSEFDFSQEMTIYTGLDKNDKTGEITTWATTKYPGVHFNVMKGASVEDDQKTQQLLNSSRKTWGIGFSAGVGFIINGNITPGAYIGIGLNYTPKKLQFGK